MTKQSLSDEFDTLRKQTHGKAPQDCRWVEGVGWIHKDRTDTSAMIEVAEGIAAHGPNVAYLSRAQSERCRQSIRNLLSIIKRGQT